ncbi:MAG: tRNA (guanosine(46)-N7)-methyltransferase TrmB, partial [Paracoccaceae bacterium]
MDNKTSPVGKPRRNSYGRRRGKTLRPRQREYLRDDLAALSPGAVGTDVNPARAPLDMGARFGPGPVWLEIGFGG